MKIWPGFETVKLNQIVEKEDLKSALERAAQKVGLKTKVIDKTIREYELGSVRKVEKPVGTDIYLKGIIFPAMRVSISSLPNLHSFYVHRGLGNGGFVSKKTFEKYLQAVCEEL